MLNRFSIKNRFLIIYMSITGLVLALGFFLITNINTGFSKENIISGLNVVSNIVAESSASSLAFSDMKSAKNHLRLLSSHNSIVYACLRVADSNAFAEYKLHKSGSYKCEDYSSVENFELSDGYVNFYKLVLLDGQSVGSLYIKASLNEIEKSNIKIAKISAVIFVGLMMLAAVISNKAMAFITQPIIRLKDMAQNVTKKQDYSLRMGKHADDEVGVLISSFNNMLEQIQSRDSELLEEKEKAEKYAVSAEKYAVDTQKMNISLEKEIRNRLEVEAELHDLNETLEDKVNVRTSEIKELNDKMVDVARRAGMAEVASGVLHNVGNVLNSVNVSAAVIREKVRKTKAVNLEKVVGMLVDNEKNIASYISEDKKGKQIPKFLSLLSDQLIEEKEAMKNELTELTNNIDHIKSVISMQQTYAGSFGVRESIMLSSLVEDALKINAQGMDQRGVKVEKIYNKIEAMFIDKHKALQIVINLISNAKHAVIDSDNEIKNITVSISTEKNMAKLEVLDTGVGIAHEDLTHLFEYGFKRRRNGHGFGLHHSALVANELGGKIYVNSDGLGKGASFILILPFDIKREE